MKNLTKSAIISIALILISSTKAQADENHSFKTFGDEVLACAEKSPWQILDPLSGKVIGALRKGECAKVTSAKIRGRGWFGANKGIMIEYKKIYPMLVTDDADNANLRNAFNNIYDFDASYDFKNAGEAWASNSGDACRAYFQKFITDMEKYGDSGLARWNIQVIKNNQKYCK